MSAPAIRVNGLGKRYRIGKRMAYRSMRESISNAVTRTLQHNRRAEETIWALKDVSFEVAAGDVVGVIGRNGAGKSTLLKVLSRITEPTEGRVELRGRVGSLLEVGTGFHLELTGRENIYLNGAILGMKRAEIARRFDEIVAFAEIERFLDTPVKHYSSGMYLRLAFAVAAHLEPEILLVDEVLAVGDASFQKKCLGKMEEVARRGRTVVFVSHDLGAIHTLTESCLLLQTGRLVDHSTSAAVVQRYLDETMRKAQGGNRDAAIFRRDRSNESPLRFTRIWTDRDDGDSLPTIECGSEFTITMELESSAAVSGANVTVILKNTWAQRVATLFSWDQSFSLDLPPGRSTVTVRVTGLPLAPGEYFADVGVNRAAHTVAFDVLLDVPLFLVSAPTDTIRWSDRPWGAVHWRRVLWKIDAVEPAERPGSC